MFVDLFWLWANNSTNRTSFSCLCQLKIYRVFTTRDTHMGMKWRGYENVRMDLNIGCFYTNSAKVCDSSDDTC